MADTASIVLDNLEFHKKPKLQADGTIYVSRENSSTSSVHISGTIYFKKYSGSYYNEPYYSGPNKGLSLYVATDQGNTGNIGSCYNLSTSYSKSISIDTYLEFTSGSLGLYIDCKFDAPDGTCTPGYGHVRVGSIDISSLPYNPWTDPTNLSNVTVSPLRIKPEGNITISWSAASSGTGNTIDNYQIAVSSNRFGWKYQEVGNVTSKNITPRNMLDNDNQIRPGDTISVAVRAHYTSQISGHDSNWLSWVYASDSYKVSVYKDGVIYYKDNSGTIHECTKGYYKDNNGNLKKIRYVKYKDNSGSTHIIDVYTTHYE